MEWFSYWSDNQLIQKPLKIQILSSISCVLWSIWDSRNNTIFRNTQPIPDQIVKKARSHIVNIFPDNPQLTPSLQLNWETPPTDHVKLNFDGAWNCMTRIGFTDWIIRDSMGNFVAGGADRGQFSSAKETEAHALLEGLKFIKSGNLKKVVCEGDAQNMIDQIVQNRLVDSPSTEVILRDCSLILKDCNIVSLSWVHRTFNRTAHHIAFWAKLADINFKQLWLTTPSWLEDLIRGDISPLPVFTALAVV